jgi:hypothetical protein
MEAEMAVQAAITQFKKEFVLTYEQRKSKLAGAAMKETISNGLTVTWLISGAGSTGAITRGQNGDIPYGSPSNTQVSATLVEKHAPESLTGFDIFASQGNQTQLLQINCYARIRRDQDQVILDELANATVDYPTTGTLTVEKIAGARAILGNADVPIEEEDNMFAIISPAAEAYLLQTTEFTNSLYVDVKPMTGGIATKYRRWMGVNWIVSSMVSGVGTSAEVLYLYHRSALGYAINMGEERIAAGFNEEQQRSWALASVYHAAKILQNTGIVKLTHDGSAYVGT